MRDKEEEGEIERNKKRFAVTISVDFTNTRTHTSFRERINGAFLFVPKINNGKHSNELNRAAKHYRRGVVKKK